MKTIYYFLFLLAVSLSCQPKLQPKPTAGFDFVVGNNGHVEFTNTSEDADRYQWVFSDGQASTEANPVVNFKKNGTYSAQLSAKSKVGSDDVTKSIDIVNIATQAKPIANFDYTVGSNGQVQFTNKSTNADHYQWIFSDGQASTETNPVMNFKKNGTYSAQLFAKSKTEDDDIMKSLEIKDITTTGTIMFWTNMNDTLDIEVYVDSGLRGIISEHKSAAPSCGDDGCVTLFYPAGTYSYFAKSKTHSWSGTFAINNGICNKKLLTK